MPTFYQKPAAVEAEQFDGENLLPRMYKKDDQFFLKDPWDQAHLVQKGDWIVTDKYNNTVAYKDDIFKKHYSTF